MSTEEEGSKSQSEGKEQEERSKAMAVASLPPSGPETTPASSVTATMTPPTSSVFKTLIHQVLDAFIAACGEELVRAACYEKFPHSTPSKEQQHKKLRLRIKDLPRLPPLPKHSPVDADNSQRTGTKKVKIVETEKDLSALAASFYDNLFKDATAEIQFLAQLVTHFRHMEAGTDFSLSLLQGFISQEFQLIEPEELLWIVNKLKEAYQNRQDCIQYLNVYDQQKFVLADCLWGSGHIPYIARQLSSDDNA